MGFALGSPFSSPYYLGGGTSALAPFVTDAALGGHAYNIDWAAEIPLRFTSVPQIRQQADQSDEPGEASINPEGFWRRSRSSFHFGAGQEVADREDSNPFRFRESQGVDIWTKWEASLLTEVLQEVASANSNLFLAVAGTHLYWTNGTSIQYWDSDLPSDTPTDITGEPVVAPTAIISDGFNVWSAHGTSGIYKTTRGAGATASHITGTVSVLGYVRNRVMAANGPSVYDVTVLAKGAAPGALPAALLTHGNTDWVWVDFAECQGYIYMAGFSGDKSLIFRTAVKSDGTALDAPAVAAELPDGEIVYSIEGYLGRFIVIGTDKGWRLGAVTASGDLTLGSRVATAFPVRAFEPQEDFVWYGLTNFTTTETGLGRLSLSHFADVDNLVPAYASDLMATAQGNVLSIVTFNNRRVFTVAGAGLYYEGTDLVPEGYIDTGEITYGMTEEKLGLWVDIAHMGEHGGIDVMMKVDHGPFVSIGSVTHVHDDPLPTFGVGEVAGRSFELKIKLQRSPHSPLTDGLILKSWLLRVQPKSEGTKLILATIILTDQLDNDDGVALDYDPDAEQAYIEGLWLSKTITTWQVGRQAYSVIIDDYQIDPTILHKQLTGRTGFNAPCFLKMKRAV